MLWQKVIGGAAAAGELGFVGGKTFAGTLTAVQAQNISLTDLTGGLASSPLAGDIIVAIAGFNSTSTSISISTFTTGYTKFFEVFNSSNRTAGFYKILESAETSVGFIKEDTATLNWHIAIHVWRNPNATQLDVSTVTATSNGAISPDAPAITTATDNAVVLAVGSVTGSSTTALTAPSGMENFFQANVSSQAIGVASKLVTPEGLYNPPAFGGGSGGNRARQVMATIAIRPA